MAEKTEKTKSKESDQSTVAAARVIWDDSQMRTTFANVVNGASTREEVTLFFGTNQSWNIDKGSDVKVLLSDRIILTPYAAKRLLVLLDAIIKSYEKVNGPLIIESGGKS